VQQAESSGIAELGHTGLYVFDLAKMRAFYTGVVGLHVTDEDTGVGIVFLSARPDIEHHELVLQRGRTAPAGTQLTNQISWRMTSFEALQHGYRRVVASGAEIQQVVTHGNALGVYFFDPEGNRNELYWNTGRTVAQPFRKSIELSDDLEQVLAESLRLVEAGDNPYQPAG
jgi:catechol-2,3-dioxygenase